jgi:serine/alanine adding enzyme
MALRLVKDSRMIDRDEWEKFVLDHPQGNVFQTPQMYSVYQKTHNYQSVVIACYTEKSLSGILVAVVQKEYKGLLGKLSARSIISGGPLIRDYEISVLETVMNEYDRTIKNYAVYTQIRNIHSMEWSKNHLQKLGYEYEDHLNIMMNLKENEEQLWGKIHTKRKNEIRRAVKEGTEFSSLQNNDSIEKTWPILAEVYKKARLPLPDVSLFKETLNWGNLPSPLKIFFALNEGKVIGVMLTLCWGDRVIDWYAGSYQQYHNKYPNDILPWEVMKWGARNGYTVFDFGGAGKPDVPYGVRDFKLKFGGELVNLGRFQKIHKPFVMRIAKRGFGFWRLLKKRK